MQSIEAAKRKIFAHAEVFRFYKYMGLKVVELEPMTAVVTLDPAKVWDPAFGPTQGGLIATLIDISMINAMLITPQYAQVMATKGYLFTIDLNIKYLRPARGVLKCRADGSIGNKVSRATAVVTDSDNKAVARGDAILMFQEGEGT